MLRYLLRRALVVLSGFAFLLPLSMARAQSGALVDVAWLQQNLGRADLLLLDASPPPMFAAGHIPGAVNASVFGYGATEQTPAQMHKLFQSWGVGTGKRVVVVDQGGSFFAPRLFFDLYHHGFPAERLFLLDGGLAKWRAAGGVVTTEATAPPAPGDFTPGTLRTEVRVRLPEFLNATGDPHNNAVVDALEPAMYYGQARFFDRAGHVPNALLLPSGDFFNADKTFKSAAEIRRMAQHLGIRPEQRIVTHCGGGIAAATPFFALKFIAGYPQVSLYPGSQLEWLRDDRGLPFWTYAAPQLLRDMHWVNGWTNRTVRSYGISQVSVIDLRAAEQYGKGHVPYALNLPAALFRQHLDRPAELAPLLAAAGVNPREEAVLVGEGGRLGPDVALAFLLLHQLGQARVSLLAGSADDWGLAGLPIATQPTVVGARRTPDDLVVRPVPYSAESRSGAVLRARDGALPPGTVLIAAGATLPAKAPAGTLLHVPYTQLLDIAGRPRPAGELWTALSKAGVPRYAPLVTMADDPGEAAALWIVLRLMGYADVKVMLP